MYKYKPIEFTVNIIPTAQMRSRSRAIPLKNRATGEQVCDKRGKPMWTATQHKSPEQSHNEQQFMQVIEQYAPLKPFDCPIVVGIRAYVPIPQSKPDWWKQAAKSGNIMPTSKPDFDNYLKQCLDAMTKTAFWYDDSQVVRFTNDSGKYYSDRPRWEIEVIPEWQPKSKKEVDELTNLKRLFSDAELEEMAEIDASTL